MPISKYFFVLFSVLNCLPALAKTPSDYWLSSKIGFKETDTYFNDVKCFEIKDTLTLSCLEGFNSAGQLSSPPEQLLPVAMVSSSPQYYQIISTYDSLALVQVITPVPLKTLKEQLAHKNLIRSSLLVTARELKEKYKNSPKSFSFSQLIRQLRSSTPAQIPDAQIAGVAITGQLTTEDPHAFVQPSEMNLDKTEEELIGVGVLVHNNNDGYDIREVIPSGAAEEAGLKPRDRILSINGQKIDFSWSLDAVIRQLLGPAQTSVTLEISRRGKVSTIKLQRKPFSLKNITSKIISMGELRIGYIKIFTFHDENVCSAFKAQASSLIKNGANSILLDVRNNMGGFVQEGECIGQLFTGKGKPMQKGGFSSGIDIFKGTTSAESELVIPELLEIPLVLIVNETSASATELLAGGLQDYQRAWIVGEKTFGKGSMQDVTSFESDPAHTNIALTTGLVYRPSGRPTQGQGVDPDFTVPFWKDISDDERWSPREFDLFPQAIPVLQSPWQQSRVEKVERILSCVELNLKSIEDYQLHYALQVALCDQNVK